MKVNDVMIRCIYETKQCDMGALVTMLVNSCHVQGVLADVGPVPAHEAIIEIPEDVLKFYVRKYQQEEGTS